MPTRAPHGETLDDAFDIGETHHLVAGKTCLVAHPQAPGADREIVAQCLDDEARASAGRIDEIECRFRLHPDDDEVALIATTDRVTAGSKRKNGGSAGTGNLQQWPGRGERGRVLSASGWQKGACAHDRQRFFQIEACGTGALQAKPS
jgi:hypothetical protein